MPETEQCLLIVAAAETFRKIDIMASALDRFRDRTQDWLLHVSVDWRTIRMRAAVELFEYPLCDKQHQQFQPVDPTVIS